MKQIQRFPLFLFLCLLLGFSSCEKEAIEINHAPDQNYSSRIYSTNPSNSYNPLDSIGLIHNEGLDYIKDNYGEVLEGSDPSERKELIAQYVSNFIETEIHTWYHDDLETSINPITWQFAAGTMAGAGLASSVGAALG